jgi:RES domain-containing protein
MPAFDATRLNGLGAERFAGTAYRNQAPGFDPRSGEGARRAGGRFNAPRSFPVIYLCLSRPCVVAELSAQAARQSISIDDLLPRELWAVTMELERVLDLTTDETLGKIGLGGAELTSPDHGTTRRIGEAAHERGYQAIRSPSATDIDQILAVFPQNLAGAVIEVELVTVWEHPGSVSA